MTTVGSALPAGKDSASRSAAAIASGVSRNWSASESPVRIWVPPRASPPSSASVTTISGTGRRDTTPPTRLHSERDSTRVGSPTCGTFGQKIQRPKSTSVKGSTKSAAKAATTTPTAQARPRPRVLGNSESSRVSRPRTTVVELATTGSTVRRTARAIATYRSSWTRSSSR